MSSFTRRVPPPPLTMKWEVVSIGLVQCIKYASNGMVFWALLAALALPSPKILPSSPFLLPFLLLLLLSSRFLANCKLRLWLAGKPWKCKPVLVSKGDRVLRLQSCPAATYLSCSSSPHIFWPSFCYAGLHEEVTVCFLGALFVKGAEGKSGGMG